MRFDGMEELEIADLLRSLDLFMVDDGESVPIVASCVWSVGNKTVVSFEKMVEVGNV